MSTNEQVIILNLFVSCLYNYNIILNYCIITKLTEGCIQTIYFNIMAT